jgi:hypothetical protein
MCVLRILVLVPTGRRYGMGANSLEPVLSEGTFARPARQLLISQRRHMADRASFLSKFTLSLEIEFVLRVGMTLVHCAK